ncbi:PAS domain S-box-containing protein [Pseudomonas sp. NFACC23-1]|nr:PAS domain S-box-containing protein [Pseudomonas sp. NFACC17-2]SEI89971.1 PAS domain S-box-containing protein [Pseudomonas sp. NFACC23-1]SFW17027.1 PAS domain S-box-containing protein [Pseudomonas sp. NFACC16-2]
MIFSMKTDALTARIAQAQLFDATFELVSSALVLLDGQGRMLKVNDAFAELFGYSLPELLGAPFSELLDPTEWLSRKPQDGQALLIHLPGSLVDRHYRHKDGSLLLGRSKMIAVGTLSLCEIVPIEVPVDEGLGQHQWLQRIVETAPGIIGTFRLNSDGTASVPWVSSCYEEYYGVTAEEVKRDANVLFERLHPEDVGRVRDSIAESARTLNDWQCEYRVCHPKKGEIWLEGRSKPTREAGGAVLWVGFLHDISERKRMEQALLESTARYQEVFDNSSDCLYLLEVTDNRQFRYIAVNASFERTSGIDRQQLIGRCLGDVIPHAGQKVMAAIRDCLACGQIIERESELELPAGLIALHSTFIPVRDEHGIIYRIVGISRDVSERRRMENRLLTSEQQFRTLAENSLSLIIRYDLNGRRTYVNPAFERETGIPVAQALHTELEAGWSADLPVTEYQNLLRQVIDTGEPVETVLEWRCARSGKVVVHAVQLIAERGVGGEVVSVLAKGHNITALKRHERLEEARLCLFEQLAKGAPLPEVLALVTRFIEQGRADFIACVMLADDDGRYLIPGSVSQLPHPCVQALGRVWIGEDVGFCGSAAWRGSAVITEDLVAAPCRSALRERLIEAGFRACWSRPIQDSLGKLLGTFCVYLRQPGRPSEDDLKLIHQASHLAAIAIERKRAETLLLESKKRYRDIFDGSLDALFLLDVSEDGRFRFVEVNPAFERRIGMGRAQLLGRTLDQTLAPFAVAIAIERCRHCVRSGVPFDKEDEFDLPSGHLAFHTTLIPVPGVDGQIRRIVGIARDITERKHTERVVHAREQEFRALVENSPDVIARFDPQGRFLYANPAAQRVLKQTLSELLGKTFSDALPSSPTAQSFQDKLELIIQNGDVLDEEFTYETPLSQNEQIMCHQVRAVIEYDRRGRLLSVLAVGRDISAMRAAERRLEESNGQLRQLSSYREATREEERKRIAREIHDELGQQLTALRMGISMLRLQFGHDHPALVERVQALMARTDQTIEVVRNVATSLRPAALNMGLIPALEWLVSEFLQCTGIACRLHVPSTRLKLDDERATAAFRVIQESLTNVARHSRASLVVIHLVSGDDYVLIEVCDNGQGFDPMLLPKGTLGMLGMRERGVMLGGKVTIDSQPGQGVRVRVHIPLLVSS